MIIFFAVLVLLLGAVCFLLWSKRQARAKYLGTALSDDQRAIVADEVPLTRRLPPGLRGAFEGKIALFLHQVEFVGCNGLEVTEEMRLSIAAQACLLVANTDIWYRYLNTVLIYPGAFKSRVQAHDGYVVTEHEVVRIGESWMRGPVVLSWAHSRQGAADSADGHNVVFHEFAHRIDALSGDTNGVPVLGEGQSFAEWEAVFLDAYERHLRNVEAGHRTVFDAYGATNHEEFFAVSVEVFMEKPKALNREAPAVYAQLAKLFRLDPLQW